MEMYVPRPKNGGVMAQDQHVDKYIQRGRKCRECCGEVSTFFSLSMVLSDLSLTSSEHGKSVECSVLRLEPLE